MSRRTIHQGRVARVEGDDTHLTFRIERELPSPNRLLGGHWRTTHREKQAWAAAFTAALITARGAAALRPAPCQGRRRITITRLVPSAAALIRDVDNLAFSAKHLVDALRDVKLIVDDTPAWADRPLPTQAVSADRTWWTIVEVAAVP